MTLWRIDDSGTAVAQQRHCLRAVKQSRVCRASEPGSARSGMRRGSERRASVCAMALLVYARTQSHGIITRVAAAASI